MPVSRERPRGGRGGMEQGCSVKMYRNLSVMEQDVPEVLVASSQFPKRVWEERCFAVSRRSAALAGSSAPRCCLGSCTVVAGTSPAEGRNDITP